MTWIQFVDLFGTCIFAISGVMTAIRKKFDLVGTLIIGFVTAIGGGTIRDVMIGKFPVSWLNDRNYIFAVVIGYAIAYLTRNKIQKFRKGMFLFDTVGIGLFTIIGFEIAMSYNLNIEICLVLGVVSACFGGIVRDVLTNEIPLIFRKEIYATACFIGGLVYYILTLISTYNNINIIASILVVIVIRYFAVKNKWVLNIDLK